MEKVAEEMDVVEVASVQERESGVVEPKTIVGNKTVTATVIAGMNVCRAGVLVTPVEKLAEIKRIEKEERRKEIPVAFEQEPGPDKAELVEKLEVCKGCDNFSCKPYRKGWLEAAKIEMERLKMPRGAVSEERKAQRQQFYAIIA
ncbi:hypothetical protein HOY80DRAFT_1040526 [Tuber brumale]|nr:hypothetical protein HOY80DRAFT_1040526 [Tuber brumale]